MEKKPEEVLACGDEIAEALEGWRVDTVSWDTNIEGGLVLHLSRGFANHVQKIVVLGFTELGMWLEKEEKIETKLPDDYP